MIKYYSKILKDPNNKSNILKNDDINYPVTIADLKVNEIIFKGINEKYNLDSHEKNLLIRKYFKNETFKSIALDLKISTNTLRKKYNKIFEKIRYQVSKEN